MTNLWKTITVSAEPNATIAKQKDIQKYLDFLANSPSSYHAVESAANYLLAQGFREVHSENSWQGDSGAYLYRQDGTIFGWRIPEDFDYRKGFRIVGTHTDSPAPKLKINPELATHGYRQIKMELYGGMLYNSWLNRELGLAGRLVSKTQEVKLVQTPAWLQIPQLAIHLDRGVNEALSLNPQKHLTPITGLDCAEILPSLADFVGWPVADIAGFDIYAYPTQKPEVFGLAQEFVAAARQDNLNSVFPTMQAVADAKNNQAITVFVGFDHEEIGSNTATGAAGPILEIVLRRIALACGVKDEQWFQMLAASSCLSSDVAHSVHPNYAAKHDRNHEPLINAGPVLKVNANQRYATDAVGMGIWQAAVAKAGVPAQVFVSNNNSPCGSTIGPITATRLGIRTVDIGNPILSMHAAREVSGVEDLAYLRRVLTTYFES